MTRLTKPMRDALQRASREPLRRTHDPSPGAPPYPAPWQSLHALVRHGLLELQVVKNRHGWPVQTWRLTDAGREALEPVTVRKDTVNYIRVPGGSTRMMWYGVWVDREMPEPEKVDPADLDAAWFGEAARRHREADRRADARRIRQQARRAA